MKLKLELWKESQKETWYLESNTFVKNWILWSVFWFSNKLKVVKNIVLSSIMFDNKSVFFNK